jgi:hypothetical protein
MSNSDHREEQSRQDQPHRVHPPTQRGRQLPQLNQAAFQVQGRAIYSQPTPEEWQQQLADVQEQVNPMVGYDGLANGGPARMYSTRAIVNQIQAARRGFTELWLDGGSTHHVEHNPSLLFNKTASHVNSVFVAGGEEHRVQCEGDMMIESPHG